MADTAPTPAPTHASLARIDDADAILTAALASQLALLAAPGATCLLDGPLGAGKTHFARAFIRSALGNPIEDVPSPSFTLVQTYELPSGVGAIWHVDLYRVGATDELGELGLDDAAAGDIRLIEWPDRLGRTPPGALTVSLRPHHDPALRVITLSGDAQHWRGLARAVQRARFIAAAGWGEAMVAPLAGDASSRIYTRLTGDAGSAVLMDAPAGSCGPYLAMTAWLRDRGFHAPCVLAADAEAGLLLLEDLGDDLLARVIDRQPDLARPAYLAITDLLVALHRHPPADGLLRLDGAELAAQVGLFAQWYGPATGAPAGAGAGIAPLVQRLHDALCADLPPVTGLRDFHAENIVWMGQGRAPGLLDFQDAVAVHSAYDLVSALQDPRRTIPPDIEQLAIDRYIAATGIDRERFGAAYALLGAQRNLRIMGIFTRLCLRDGKSRYLAFMPRCWSLLAGDLAHPALAPLAREVAAFRAPAPALIERIAQQCRTHPTR